jgi:hypothetical protein
MRRQVVPLDSFSDHPIQCHAVETDEDAMPADVRAVLLLRLVGTLAAATVFVGRCWLARGSVYADLRWLAGPILFDSVSAAVVSAILLPCLFAVGVRASPVTIALAIVASLFWVGLGLFSEICAGC